MDRAASTFLVPIAIVGALAPQAAHATQYMTVAEAQRHFFPSATRFVDRSLDLTSAQRKAIKKASGTTPPKRQPVYQAIGGAGGWLFVDRVLGKHEYITYAVALSTDGTVRGIEILDYRESYGDEVRGAGWRKQFVGARADRQLRFGKEVKNISGATLSSRHVTDGVRRVLKTFDLLVAR